MPKVKVRRSAISGKFVSKGTVKRRPKTTVTETRHRKSVKRKKK
jgi:hypothetical protein